jgi:hypothetical protein
MSSQVSDVMRETEAPSAPDVSVMSAEEYQEWYWQDMAARFRRENVTGLGRSVKQGKRVRVLWARWTEDRSEWNRRWEWAIRFAGLLSETRFARLAFILLQSLLACFAVDGKGAKSPSSYLVATPQAEGTGPAGIVRFAARPCTPHAPPGLI